MENDWVMRCKKKRLSRIFEGVIIDSVKNGKLLCTNLNMDLVQPHLKFDDFFLLLTKVAIMKFYKIMENS
jgi:hypothetical protein